jgi:hypothetical protein
MLVSKPTIIGYYGNDAVKVLMENGVLR